MRSVSELSMVAYGLLRSVSGLMVSQSRMRPMVTRLQHSAQAAEFVASEAELPTNDNDPELLAIRHSTARSRRPTRHGLPRSLLCLPGLVATARVPVP